jgi:hypothetical protein
MGQKMVCFGQLRPTRSRQDESIEVGEVGSKRPSSGGNGGHVVWWIGLIFRLLRGGGRREKKNAFFVMSPDGFFRGKGFRFFPCF